jgi:hypothetical protein
MAGGSLPGALVFELIERFREKEATLARFRGPARFTEPRSTVLGRAKP